MDEAYYRTSMPILNDQLAIAGIRLAKVLNETLGEKKR